MKTTVNTFVFIFATIGILYLLNVNSTLKQEVQDEKKNCDRKTQNYVDFFGCNSDDGGMLDENMPSTTNNKREDYTNKESLEYDLYLLGEGKVYKHPK